MSCIGKLFGALSGGSRKAFLKPNFNSYVLSSFKFGHDLNLVRFERVFSYDEKYQGYVGEYF